MTLEEALKTAIEYETRISDIYREACEKFRDFSGSRLVRALEKDERHHVDYLKYKLEQCIKDGKITLEKLDTAIPSKEAIAGEVERLDKNVSKGSTGDKRMFLSKALNLEIETSEFYRKMVDSLPEDGRTLFARFLEIEAAHIALVQAEFDHFNKTGYWFDMKEFDME